jgi:hypothetical protein
MDAATKRLVRQRARNCCEYCGLRQDHSPLATLQIEHVTPKKHGGGDELENLALACIDCNLAKSSNIAGRDPETDELTPLFHPRVDQWDDHFSINGIDIVGKTAVGRTTIYVLNMNSDYQLELRAAIRKF